MKSFIYHIQINVKDKKASFAFYKDFLGLLDYQVLFEDEDIIDMSNGTTDIILMPAEDRFKADEFHRKKIGLNHLSFGVQSKENVGEFIEKFLKPRKIKALYDSPRDYPEYEEGYYSVF